LATALAARRRVVASGSAGSSTHLVAGAVAQVASRLMLLVVAHLDEADDAADELIEHGIPAIRFPALEVLPGETNVSLDLFAERLGALREIIASPVEQPRVIVAPIQALMQHVPIPARFGTVMRLLRKGDTVEPRELAGWLDAAGYRRVEAVEEPGDFSLRGGILDVFPPGTPPALSSASADEGGVFAGVPVRLDFFGDTLDRINEIDLNTMGSDRVLPASAQVQLVCADVKAIQSDVGTCSPLDLFPKGAAVMLAETFEIVEQARGYYERVLDSRGIGTPPSTLKLLNETFHALAEVNQFSAGAAAADTRIALPIAPLHAFSKELKEAIGELVAPLKEDATRRVMVSCQNAAEAQRLGELLVEAGAEVPPEIALRVESLVAYTHRGMIWGQDDDRRGRADGGRVWVVPYHEILNRFTTRRVATKLRAGRAMDTFLDIQPGDYVVHADHGVSRFIGLTQMPPRALPGRERMAQTAALGLPKKAAGVNPSAAELEEFLTLEFANNAKLHVPAVQIDKVQKYVGGFKGKPPLSVLGGEKWKNQKQRASESARDLAGELLRVRAAREHLPGVAFPGDTAWQKEFEDEFPYEETDDQLAALAEIKRDMTRARPMDRLICGDVGFGKTELAIRAAFKACEFGKQVAVLVPTTVLAEQHERTFRSRFAGYPFRVESLSRFKTDAEQRVILEAVRKGQVDLVIGTHRLLSKDVHFADLGLVVIDEEQRFGVEHKDELLRLRLTVDVLTLSATPIPRTLHMALLGLRDISSLTVAPADRRAIVTEVMMWNEKRLQQVIARELARDGQVYFVHNRVHDIQSIADNVQKLAPDAKIVIGHGQMEAKELEEVILKFVRGQADILVATTIIESGIDIPTANTMIIHEADRYGLADLHQLRGRVGRSKHRAYCYLVLPENRQLTDVARKRLMAIEQFSMLGAGFKIAMRDLEIRGAGNLLGAEQSGHIATVGYEMYCRLLEDGVKELQSGKQQPPPGEISIEVGILGVIPKTYIPSDLRRLEAYRRLATAHTLDDVANFRRDLVAAYGEPPRPAERLLELTQLRIACAELAIRAVALRERDVIFFCQSEKRVAEGLNRGMTVGTGSSAGTVTALPPKSPGAAAEVYLRLDERLMEPDTLMAVLRRRLGLTVTASRAPAHVNNQARGKGKSVSAGVQKSKPAR
jgi:transcription-repair coupling factor (superfamily II helicase)